MPVSDSGQDQSRYDCGVVGRLERPYDTQVQNVPPLGSPCVDAPLPSRSSRRMKRIESVTPSHPPRLPTRSSYWSPRRTTDSRGPAVPTLGCWRPTGRFCGTKQRAVEQASHDWIFSLDADERIPASLAIEGVLRAGTAQVAFSVPRQTWWQGQPVRWGCWSPDRRFRLFRRTDGRWAGREPRSVGPRGPTGRLHTPLEHRAYRGLGDHLMTVARGTSSLGHR